MYMQGRIFQRGVQLAEMLLATPTLKTTPITRKLRGTTFNTMMVFFLYYNLQE